PGPKAARVGFLSDSVGADFDPWFATLKSGLKDLGYVEGQSVAPEFRGQGGVGPLPALAADLVAANVDIVVVGNLAVPAAAKATVGDRRNFEAHAHLRAVADYLPVNPDELVADE